MFLLIKNTVKCAKSERVWSFFVLPTSQKQYFVKISKINLIWETIFCSWKEVCLWLPYFHTVTQTSKFHQLSSKPKEKIVCSLQLLVKIISSHSCSATNTSLHFSLAYIPNSFQLSLPSTSRLLFKWLPLAPPCTLPQTHPIQPPTPWAASLHCSCQE